MMKKMKTYYIFAAAILLCSCKVQTLVVDIRSESVVVFKALEKSTKLLHSNVYSKRHLSIQSRGWSSVNNHIRKRGIVLIQKNDTMKIICFCPEVDNRYFKDIKFKKGFYLIEFNQPLDDVKGSEIPTPKSVQNILFKNTLIDDSIKGYSYSDLNFKDIKFKVIDFSDTINVKLKPVSKEEF